MWFNQILYTLLVAAIAKACKGPDTCGDNDGLTVTTITGKYTGLPNTEYNGVREFRSIPYAKAPVGDLRWQPPVALRPSTKHHYSHRFPPSCPQYLTSRLTLWNTNISDFSIATAGQSHHAGQFAQASTEDCLKLAVWTPRNTSRGDGLPVALFVPGGSFVTGGVEVPYQNPAGFVNHTQKHIVVTMNWRVNLFGFPNAAGLEHQNLGILDVRMALEWVYANIGAFGGDPRRIVLWGQSAGGVAADVLDFAYDNEPLVAGFFLHSGAAVREFAEGDDALQTNFSFVARHVGCDGFSGDDSAAAELECMRQVPAALLSNFVGAYGDNKTKPGLWFRPTVDDRLIFRNYTARGLAGRISRVPALISTTANEQASLAKWNPGLDASLASSPSSNSQQPRHNPPPDQAKIDKVTLSDFVCVAREAAVVRAAHNLTTYRYQWAGNYTNLTPYPWMGAYHASDVPIIFGTYDLHGGATEGQRRAAEALQDYVFAFLEDPENGIRRHLGWQPDVAPFRDDEPMVRLVGGDGDGGATSRIGGGGGADDGRVAVKQISAAEVDGACTGSGTYNPSPS
ncbi:carboxylesterase [Apiospora rasikravindrae]|uniref:Carboxylic ester hydrolase n=1 Tax=Apiospora rasikravindrae TaxID=990691 RepID=A0ABR1SJS5_9PEZI